MTNLPTVICSCDLDTGDNPGGLQHPAGCPFGPPEVTDLAPLSPEREASARQQIADLIYGTYGQFDHHRTYAIADAVMPAVRAAVAAELDRDRAEQVRANTEWQARLDKANQWATDQSFCTQKVEAERDELKKRVAELEAAASAGMKSLSAFIFDTTDPGVDALGAQWLLQQAMPQVDDPFAEPNRYRQEILRQAAKQQRDFIVSDDYVCDDWEAALDVVDLIDPDEQTAASEGGA